MSRTKRADAAMGLKLWMAEERMRRRIAEGLHDQIGQSLMAVQLRLAAIHRRGVPAGSEALLGEAEELVAEILGAVRCLTFELGCPVLAELGLEAALEDLAKRTALERGVRIDVTAEGAARRMDLGLEAVLYRAACELVSNAVRHAQARAIRLCLARTDGWVRLSVADDGRGMRNGERRGTGYGLASLAEQVRSLGGELGIETRPGRGVRVEVWLSLEGSAPRGEP
ncbi:MAG TPA: ATP-binding protein [Thermoanaerobaculia bacterium]|nr:ATP-binding protein [Thermoanaerobaculia bacterium]